MSKKEKVQLRLQKVIADCGVASRRKAEELIVQGRVKVNNEVVTEMGIKVDPLNDIVEVDGNVIDLLAVQQFYLVLNKPRGYVSTVSDPEGRKTVLDLCKGINARIFPVGRLDYLSEGLLILTNDGNVANTIMHPRYEVTKVYEVKVFGAINEGLLKKIRKGIVDKGEELKPLAVRVLKKLENKTWLEFRLNEGKNREIRRICEAFNLTVDKLKRVAIEGLSVQGIAPGEYRFITKENLLDLLNLKEDGSRKRAITKDFVSIKKTVKIKDRKIDPTKTSYADDPKFQKYRKETYNDTMKLYKDLAKQKAIKERVEYEQEDKERVDRKRANKINRKINNSGTKEVSKPKVRTTVKPKIKTAVRTKATTRNVTKKTSVKRGKRF